MEKAIDAAEALLAMGHAPLVPHLNHFWHARSPQPDRVWLDLDLAWLEVADAVLRLPGASEGADEECRLAAKRGIPVYDAIEGLPPRCP